METEKVLVFFDVEATGVDPEDRLCQIAFTTTDDNTDVHMHYFKPPVPIKIAAMAVHHITEKMIEDKPAFIGSELHDQLKQWFEHDGHIFVAHNAKYDHEMMQKEGINATFVIDTLKVAKHVFPDAEAYALQYLRYWLGIEVEATAHDAAGDVLVLERVFYRMLERIMEQRNLSVDTALEQMMQWTKEPILIKYFNFGKHKNKSLEEVAQQDPGYLSWLLNEKIKAGDNDEDWLHTLRYYLNQ